MKTARVDGAIVAIDPPPKLTKAKEHTIDLIVHYGPLEIAGGTLIGLVVLAFLVDNY